MAAPIHNVHRLKQIISWLFASAIGLVAVIFAIVNRESVSLNLWPFPWRLDAPVFILVLLTIAGGFLAGWLCARLGTMGLHHRLRQQQNRIAQLERAQAVERPSSLPGTAAHHLFKPDHTHSR